MTVIAVVSDSHGNADYVQHFLNDINSFDIDFVYHLGDYYDDAQLIIDAGYSVIRVPGTWTRYYDDFRVDKRRFEDIKGWRFFLSHTPSMESLDTSEDYDPQLVVEQQQCHVMLHGHTHCPSMVLKNGVLIINPGHIKASTDRGFPASYCMLTISEDQLDAEIYHLKENATYQKDSFSKSEFSFQLS